MATTSEIRGQISQARQTFSQRKQEAKETEEKLVEAKSSLPEIRSQQALRQTYAGLKGRAVRRQVAGKEREISGELAKVGIYKGELGKQEQEFEAQAGEAERQIQIQERLESQIQKAVSGRTVIFDTEEERLLYVKTLKENPDIRRAIDEATETKMALSGKVDIETGKRLTTEEIKLGAKGIPEFSYYGFSTPQEYLQVSKEFSITEDKPMGFFRIPPVDLPEGEVGIYNKKGELTGIESGALGRSVKVEDYNSLIQKGREVERTPYKASNLKNDIEARRQSILPTISSDKTLKSGFTLTGYGVSDVSNRISTGDSLLVRGGQYISNAVGNISDIGSGFNKKTQEVYVKGLGGFASASQVGVGAKKETIIIDRPVTPQELAQRDRLSGVPKYIFGDTISGNAFTINSEDFKSKIRVEQNLSNQLSSLSTELENLSKNKIDETTQEWKGTEKERGVYNKKLNEYQRVLNKYQTTGATISPEGTIQAPTIKTGLFGLFEDRPISEFKVLAEPRPIKGAIKIISTTAETTLGLFGEGVSKEMGLPEEGVYSFTTSAKNITTNVSYPYLMRGTTQMSTITGQPILSIETTREVPEKTYNIFTPKQVGGIGRVVGGLSPYLNPAGGYIFGAEQLESIGFHIGKEEKIGKGFVSYIKESPIEATIFVGGSLFLAGRGIYKATKTSKYGKYLSDAESKVLSLQDDAVKNVMKEQRNVPRVESVIRDNVGRINLREKTRGSTTTSEYYTKGGLTGSVVETRYIGDKVIKFKDTGGIPFVSTETPFSVNKKLAQYTGTVSIGKDGQYLEIIKYGDDIIKITETGKGGTGTIKLFEKGELVVTKKIKAPSVIDDLGKIKKKTELIKINEQVNVPQTVTEISFNTGKVRVEGLKRTVEQQTGDIVLNLDDLARDPYLKSTKVTGEIRTDITKATNIKAGTFQIQAQDYGFTDIIQSSPRKGSLQVTSKGKNILIKRRVGQEIVEGVEKEVDKISRLAIGDESVTKRIISPYVTREIEEYAGVRIIKGYVKPNSKFFTSTDDILRLQQKEASKLAKDVRKTLAQDKVQLLKEKINLFKEQVKEQARKINFKVKGQGQVQEAFYRGESMFGDMSRQVYVPETATYLRGIPEIGVNVPLTFDIIETGAKTTSLTGLGILGGISTVPKIETTQLISIKTREETKESTELQPRIETSITQTMDVKTRPILKSPIRENIKIEQKELQELKVNQILKTLQQPRLEQKQRLRTRQELRKTQEPMRPKEPITPIVPILTSSGSGEGRTAKEQVGRLFEVFKRAKGGTEEYIKVGEEVNIERAGKTLSKTLKGGLEATGYVQEKRTGKKLSFGELAGILGGEFRPSKVSPFLAIQRKERRLGTGIERVKIQRAKSISPKRRRNNKWL